MYLSNIVKHLIFNLSPKHTTGKAEQNQTIVQYSHTPY